MTLFFSGLFLGKESYNSKILFLIFFSAIFFKFSFLSYRLWHDFCTYYNEFGNSPKFKPTKTKNNYERCL